MKITHLSKCDFCKGKVVDEPNEWVYGALIDKSHIYQTKEHDGSINCGLGLFEVDPCTVEIIKEGEK